MGKKKTKPTVDSLQGDIDRHGSYFKRIFETLDKIYESIVGSPDGKVEGMRHAITSVKKDVSSLRQLYDDHEEQHKEEDGKVSEKIAEYDAGIQKNFKFVWIGVGLVGLISAVGLWLALGLPGKALKGAALMIYDVFGG